MKMFDQDGNPVLNKEGKPYIPAYTVASSYDDVAKFTYWIVNLEDYVVETNARVTFKLFHDRKSAEEFAAQHRGKGN